MKSVNNTIVCFHVGRGGRFHNAGHVSYCRFRTPEEHFNFAQEKNWLFLDPENWHDIKRQIGNRPNLLEKWDNMDYDFFRQKGFDLGEMWYFDTNNNAIISEEDVESGIFILDFDGGYNTYYTQYLEDCTESELKLIVEEDCDYVQEAKELLINVYDCYEFEEEEKENYNN